MKVVLDTCVVKLATLPNPENAAATILQLLRMGLVEAWVSPPILEEYGDVLNEHPDLLDELLYLCQTILPIVEVHLIRHQPDNRFLECAFAADVDCLVTVNTARGHFERKIYEGVRVVRPSEFLSLPEVLPLLRHLTHL